MPENTSNPRNDQEGLSGTGEEKYHTLFNLIEEGFCVMEMIFDGSGKPVDCLILEVNPALERMTGFREMAGKHVREVIPDIEDRWIETCGRVALTGEALRIENCIHAVNRWFSVRAARVGGAGSRMVALVYADVTERKIAQDELRQAASRTEAHMHNSPLAIIEFDSAFRVIRWSSAAERIFGWKADEIVGRSIAEMHWVHEGDKTLVARVLNEMFSGRKRCTINVNRNYRKDGSVIHCEWYNSAIHDARGRLTSVFSQVLDVTDRKWAEDAVRESKERFKAFMNNSQTIAWMKDEQGRYVYVSEPYEKRFGVRLQDCYGKTDSDLWPPRMAEKFADNDTKVLESNQAMNVFEPTINPDGSPTYWWNFKFPYQDSSGKKYVGGIGVDITERKHAEDALRESEKRFRAFMDNNPAVAWMKDEQGYFVYINQSYEKRFGLQLNDLRGKTDFDIWPREIAEEFRRNDLSVLDTGRTAEVVENWPGSGSERSSWWIFRFLIRDAAGRRFVGGIGVDITGRRKAENDVTKLNAELRQSIDELAQTNKELEAFIYSVSHDLRSPLRSIAGFSEMLQKHYSEQLDEKGKKYLGRIQINAVKMNETISHLLHLSRISRQELRRQEVDLSSIADSLLTALREADPRHPASVHIRAGITASADPGLIEVALSNLLGNAWKFTSKKETARIEFGIEDRSGKQAYYVKDNGAGFDQNYSDRLFLPFHRLHTDQQFEGTGIGLAITERVIKRHGGRIWAEGKTDQGAAFFFTLQ